MQGLRRPGFIDKNRINLVNNGISQLALTAVISRILHVVAQVIKTIFAIGTVGNIGGISFTLSCGILLGHDHADAKAKKSVKPTHPLSIAGGQIVIDRYHMNAL